MIKKLIFFKYFKTFLFYTSGLNKTIILLVCLAKSAWTVLRCPFRNCNFKFWQSFSLSLTVTLLSFLVLNTITDYRESQQFGFQNQCDFAIRIYFLHLKKIFLSLTKVIILNISFARKRSFHLCIATESLLSSSSWNENFFFIVYELQTPFMETVYLIIFNTTMAHRC